MVDVALMPAEDAIFLLELLNRAGARTWLEGGWGVDALTGVQSRAHGDLDIFIERNGVDTVRAILSAHGFVDVAGARPDNFVLKHGALEVDIHVFDLDESGNGLYAMADGTIWVCPAAGLAGRGQILGREVQCFTEALQLQCYSGYELDENDLHDIAVLRRQFPGVQPLPLDVRAGR